MPMLDSFGIGGRIVSVPNLLSMKTVASVLRILFGLLWLWAGIVKIKDPIGFSMEIRNYELIGDPWVAMAALTLPPLEILCALAVIFRKGAAGGLAILNASLVVFTVAIVISWARGLDISCGCFSLGGDSINYPIKVTENIALLGVGCWLWWIETRVETRSAPDHSLPKDPVAAS